RHRQSDNGELRGVHFNVAGRELRILHVPGARDHFALHFDDRLTGQAARGAAHVFRRGGPDGDLHDPSAVAQVDEHDAAEVAAPGPASRTNTRTGSPSIVS